MPAIVADAPGKIILFGEHAVVYHRPAIAVPVNQARAKVTVQAEIKAPAGSVAIEAPDIQLACTLDQLSADHPIGLAIRNVFRELQIVRPPAMRIHITSTIPIAAGMGSGAAITVAITRALSIFLGAPLPDETASSLAYEVDRLHHGTPSGIDNTVITFGRPVYYIKNQPPQLLSIGKPMTLVIADTGIQKLTTIVVSGVRERWEKETDRYERLFDQIGAVANQARKILEKGNPDHIGPLMDENQALLEQIGVSSVELETLVAAARKAGALGAKLSGAGAGGNMIALAAPEKAQTIASQLIAAGAVRTIITKVDSKP